MEAPDQRQRAPGAVGPVDALRHADRLHQQGQHAAAIERYTQAVAADPGLYEAWYGLGCARLSMQAYGDAAEALRRTVALRPDAYGARCNLAEALFQLGDVDAAIAEYRVAADKGTAEMRAVALAGIACIVPGGPAQSNASIMAARQEWGAAATSGIRAMAPRPRTGAKLRVGYLSGFFAARNWMKLYMGVINAHDRGRFELHLLSDGGLPCAESGYADRDEDRIWDIAGVPNADLAQHIADARLDVLVDLSGYSGQHRLPLFAYRAAPLQISWLGMYGTTGLRQIDRLVGDAVAVPLGEEGAYTEQIVRVPGTYLAFDVFYPVPEVVPPPSVASRQITFGCLSSAYKLTDLTIGAYAAILRQAPAAQLLLRNRTLDEASNRAALLSRFARLGIGPERLVLEGGGEHLDFLRSYDRVDVALDTFPYNGGTTTVEALWQGVPMLTCDGDRWAARTSASLLRAGGLPEWVAADISEFQQAAVRLAHAFDTPERLAVLRDGMRPRLRASAACDVTGVCRSLEALYAA